MRACLLIELVQLIGVLPPLDTEDPLVGLVSRLILNLKTGSSFNRFGHRWIKSLYSKDPLTKLSNLANQFFRASKCMWRKKS